MYNKSFHRISLAAMLSQWPTMALQIKILVPETTIIKKMPVNLNRQHLGVQYPNYFTYFLQQTPELSLVSSPSHWWVR